MCALAARSRRPVLAAVAEAGVDRVAVYVRWSTDEQADGTTLTVQLDACRHYVLSQGWPFRPDLVFVDEGHSGSTLDRPALARLRAAVAQGQVDCVVTYKLDRLSRSLLDTVELVLREWAGRCHYKSAREPIDTTTPTGRMFFYILAGYAEWERALIVDRLFSGKKARAQQGKNPGQRPPFGYRPGTEPGTFTLHPPEAEVVRRIFADCRRGLGTRTIAAGLTAAGVPTRSGRPWSQNTVLWILRNEAYRGVLVYGRHARVEGAFPAIVTAATWQDAQSALGQRARQRARRSAYLLSGIARCRCGAALAGSEAAPGYRYYHCSRARQAGPSACTAAPVAATALEDEVVALVRHLWDEPAAATARHLVQAELAAQGRRLRAGLTGLAEQLAAVGQRIRRIRTDYETGRLPAALYARHLAEYEAEAARLGERQADAKAALMALRRHQDGLESAAGRVATDGAAVAGWGHLSTEERRQVLRHLVASLQVWRPRDKVHTAVPAEVHLVLRRQEAEPVAHPGETGEPGCASAWARAAAGEGEPPS